MLYLVIYVILLVISLFLYWRKRRRIDAGVIMLSLYIIYAFFSILLYKDKTFEFQYFHISLFPLLFLFVCLMFSFSPVLSFDSLKYTGIQSPTKWYLDVIAWVIILSYVFQSGFVFSHLYSGISFILLDEDGGADLYTKMADNAASGGIGISNIFAIVGNMFYEFGILLLFYNLTLKKKNKYIIIGLSLAMIIGILTYLAAGQRGGMIKRTLVTVGTFFLLKDYIDYKTKRKVKRIGIIVIAVVSFLFMAISLSRFSNREGGVESSFNRYAGQSVLYFDQYAFDNNGIRYGDRVAPVFKRLLTFDDVPRNYMERRAKYPQLHINDEVFVTFVGDFCFDFGPVIAFLLIILFSFLNRRTIRYNGAVFPFHKLIILHFCLCVCLQGGSLFPYADLGNVGIILYVLLYLFFSIDYNEQHKILSSSNQSKSVAVSSNI